MQADPIRRFKLIEEFELSEKGKNDPTLSYGLEDPNDMTMTYWNAMIMGPDNV